MRLQMRYESAEMGMDDEHWSLNIMSKLAKHKPAQKKEREKAAFRALEIPQHHHVGNSSRIFLAKIATGVGFIRCFFGSSVLMLNWECMVFHLRRKMISRNDLTVSTDFGEFLSSTWFSAGQICWFEIFNYFLRFKQISSQLTWYRDFGII